MEAVSGVADLVGPALGSVTMETRIWIPFLLAMIAFSLMFVPVGLVTNDHKLLDTEDTPPRSAEVPSDEAERRPLIRDDDALPTEASPGAHDSHASGIFGTRMSLYAIAFGSFFLISLARDSNNFLIPWVSWRFDETMASVCSVSGVLSMFGEIVMKAFIDKYLGRIIVHSQSCRLFASAVYSPADGQLFPIPACRIRSR